MKTTEGFDVPLAPRAAIDPPSSFVLTIEDRCSGQLELTTQVFGQLMKPLGKLAPQSRSDLRFGSCGRNS